MADLMSKKSFAEANISISMQPSPELTEGQKACLRLVVQHHTSQAIARKLNAASPKDAAKMFAALRATRGPAMAKLSPCPPVSKP